jgi:zinc/manganese transport system substrate-binding protein
MKTLLIALFVLLVPRLAAAELHVVATVPDLAAIARDVGAGHVEVTTLALPTQDPHFVDARPSLALALSKADVLLAVGLDLEIGWLPTLQVGARNPKIQAGSRGYLECAQFVRLQEIPSEKLDRAHGDIHPGGNPHYLLDPRQAELVAFGIAARFGELDPGHAADYAGAARAFVARVEGARKGWEQKLAPLKGQPVITYHRSWVYLTAWLGLDLVATLEPKPGIPPSAQHVATVLGLGRKRGVKVILQESYYPAATSKLVAAKLPAQVVSPAGGADASEGYIARMDKLVALLAAGFGVN